MPKDHQGWIGSLAIAALVVATPGHATDQTAPSAPADQAALSTPVIRVIEMETAAVARLVADHHGLVLQVSDAVRGTVSDLRLSGDVDAMMAALAAEAGIDWFIYGGVLAVSARDETITRFIPLGSLTYADAQRILTEADIDVARVGFRSVADGSAARLSGPPKAVEAVEAVLSLSTETDDRTAQAVVVRRGTERTVEFFGAARLRGYDETSPDTNSGTEDGG